MGVAKRTRKFAQTKRMLGKNDPRLKENQKKAELANKKKAESGSAEVVREVYAIGKAMKHFFHH